MSQTTRKPTGNALVGRADEQALIRLVMDGDDEGALLLRGDPGIGKSALLTVADGLARADQRFVLTTVGVEAEAQIPFAGLHQLLAPLLDRADALPMQERAALLSAFGLAEGTSPELFLIARAVLTLLNLAAQTQPLALVCDDLQWLDMQSNDVLNFITQQMCGPTIVVVGAVRSGHAGRFLAGGREVDLAGLDAASADELLRSVAPRLSALERSRIHQQALGNPLALQELPSDFAPQSGALDEQPSTLSERLERAFAARLDELPAPTRDVVLVAAVDYADDVREILQAGSILTGRELATGDLEPAERLGLLRVVEGRVRFRHPLVRSAILQQETRSRRHAANASLAAILTADPYRRTWHRAMSIVGPDEEIASELELSAAESLRRGAVVTAIQSLERAAQLTGESALRGHRLLAAGEHAFDIGRVDLLQRLLDAARHTRLSELDADRMQWLREIFNDGTPGDAGRVLELCDVAARAASGDDLDLALNLLLGAAMRCWWADTGPAARARVVEVLRRTGADPSPHYAAILAVAQPVSEGAEVNRLLKGILIEDANDFRLAGMAAHAIGDSPRAGRLLDQAESLLRVQGRLGLLAHVLSMQVVIRLEVGDLSRAVDAVEEGLRLAEQTGQPIWSTGTLVCAARAEAMQGHSEQAFDLATRAELAANRQRLNDLLACVQMARGLAYLDIGSIDSAYRAFRSLFDPASSSFHQRERFDGVMFLAETAVACNMSPDARDVLADLEAIAEQTPSPLLHAHLQYARPVLADEAQAEHLYRASLDYDLREWPWVRGRLEHAYALWLQRAGRLNEAITYLESAGDIFKRTGAAHWEDAVRGDLRALRRSRV